MKIETTATTDCCKCDDKITIKFPEWFDVEEYDVVFCARMMAFQAGWDTKHKDKARCPKCIDHDENPVDPYDPARAGEAYRW